jgi:hypothetical protein
MEANHLCSQAFEVTTGAMPEERNTMLNEARSERTHDETLEQSFPASDPPAGSGITGSESSDKASDRRTSEDKPTGTPTSDRHESETTHQREDEVKLRRQQ